MSRRRARRGKALFERWKQYAAKPVCHGHGRCFELVVPKSVSSEARKGGRSVRFFVPVPATGACRDGDVWCSACAFRQVATSHKLRLPLRAS